MLLSFGICALLCYLLIYVIDKEDTILYEASVDETINLFKRMNGNGTGSGQSFSHDNKKHNKEMKSYEEWIEHHYQLMTKNNQNDPLEDDTTQKA